MLDRGHVELPGMIFRKNLGFGEEVSTAGPKRYRRQIYDRVAVSRCLTACVCSSSNLMTSCFNFSASLPPVPCALTKQAAQLPTGKLREFVASLLDSLHVDLKSSDRTSPSALEVEHFLWRVFHKILDQPLVADKAATNNGIAKVLVRRASRPTQPG